MSGHKSEDMTGRLKEAVGALTGDKALKREGKIDQSAAAAKRQFDKATDKIQDVITPKP